MKLNKVLAASMITAMVALPTSSVFAATNTKTYSEAASTWSGDSVTQEIPVYATTTLGADKYAVDIEWGSMEFTYTGSEWDVTNHEYGTTADWTITGGEDEILVRNHSSQPVNVSATVAKESGVTGLDDVTVSVSNFSSSTIDASPITHKTGNDNIPTATATVSVTGQPGATMTKTKIATVTVTVSK